MRRPTFLCNPLLVDREEGPPLATLVDSLDELDVRTDQRELELCLHHRADGVTFMMLNQSRSILVWPNKLS